MKKILSTLFAFMFVSVLMAQPPAGVAKVGDVYGENFTAGKTIKPKALTNQLKDGPVDGIVRGKVVEVCPKKGCWVKLELADKSLATVKMKDYAFFVPTSLEGKTVAIDGNIEIKTTPVKELQHYAEDAKKSKEEIEAITEDKQEIRILANGIRVL